MPLSTSQVLSVIVNSVILSELTTIGDIPVFRVHSEVKEVAPKLAPEVVLLTIKNRVCVSNTCNTEFCISIKLGDGSILVAKLCFQVYLSFYMSGLCFLAICLKSQA